MPQKGHRCLVAWMNEIDKIGIDKRNHIMYILLLVNTLSFCLIIAHLKHIENWRRKEDLEGDSYKNVYA